MKFIIIDDDNDLYFDTNIEINNEYFLTKLNVIRYFFVKMIFDLETIKYKQKLKFLNNLLNIGNIITNKDKKEITYYVSKGTMNHIFYNYKFNEESFYNIPQINNFKKYTIYLSNNNIKYTNDFSYRIKHSFINNLFHHIILNKDNQEDSNFVIWKFALLYDIGNKLIESNLICNIEPLYEYYEFIFTELFTKIYHNHNKFQEKLNSNDDNICYYLCYH